MGNGSVQNEHVDEAGEGTFAGNGPTWSTRILFLGEMRESVVGELAWWEQGRFLLSFFSP